MTKDYKFQGETFQVSKPDDCRMTVSGLGLTGNIYIHTQTNQYREDLDGWGLDHQTLNAALDSVCRRIIDKAARPTPDDLCKGMDDFYDKLGK